ncbi:hypothetical protein DHEL01_v204275 [Diaporthe helianthi]|uniref:Helicase C-terminal domain-containing protein n=1 Tax=Diaporthe helianthi TaxID=158607 RepID=A0A2P5I4B9_DIAHE|nr:hypothetical protein DHEL01_v204275 [Diaporthe helianthi]
MRVPGHQLLGGPLYDLPKTHYYAPSFSLSPEEAIIYEYLEKHITEYINKKSGKTPNPKAQPSQASKNSQGETSASKAEELGFESLCEVALRFRQLVASPLLLEQLVRGGIWTSDQLKEMRDKAHSRGCAQTPFIDHFGPCGLSGRGDDFLGFQPKEEFGTTLFQDLDADSRAAVPLSSKMHEILEQIRAWQNAAPDDKIILFFQFIGIQKLLGRVFQDQGIEFLYFVGEMDNKQREAAKKCFQSDRNIKMMSMKCGGEGLNLTMANRVVIADPWFNRSVEQAICRVARIGQTKDVHAVRFLARDTIDTRMQEMQENKMKKISNALQYFQGDKSLGPHALRRVLGFRFQREGDDDDQGGVEVDEEDYDTIEDGDAEGEDEED